MNCSRCSVRRALVDRAAAACAIAVLSSAAGLYATAARAPLADAAERMDRAAIRALLDQRAEVNTPQVVWATVDACWRAVSP